jgi:hypothetical protein
MWLRCSIVVAVVLVVAACETDPASFGTQYGGGASTGAPTRCRVDPDDPQQQPGAQALRDREWEDPNDDGRPTCRSRPNPPLRMDGAPPPGLPMTGTPAPVSGQDAATGSGDLVGDGATERDGADGGVDGDSDGQAA